MYDLCDVINWEVLVFDMGFGLEWKEKETRGLFIYGSDSDLVAQLPFLSLGEGKCNRNRNIDFFLWINQEKGRKLPNICVYCVHIQKPRRFVLFGYMHEGLPQMEFVSPHKTNNTMPCSAIASFSRSSVFLPPLQWISLNSLPTTRVR